MRHTIPFAAALLLPVSVATAHEEGHAQMAAESLPATLAHSVLGTHHAGETLALIAIGVLGVAVAAVALARRRP